MKTKIIRHEPGKAIKLPNGIGRMKWGQIIRRKDHVMKQQPRASNTQVRNLARDGAAKNITAAEPVAGQKRQTTGDLHPYIHGVSVEGGAILPTKAHEKAIPLHPSTPARVAEKLHPTANDPKTILAEASRLGRPPEKA